MLKNRFTYFTTVILLILLIFIHETPMTYIALYAVLILPVFSLVFTLISRKSFTITESLEKESIVKGEGTTYFFNVKNNSFFPCTNVGIHFESESPAIDVSFTDKVFSIMPHHSYEAKFDLVSKYSGKYELGVKNIVLYDFLGLFSFKQPHKNKIKIHVKPNVISLEKLPMLTTNQSDQIIQNNSQEDDYTTISDLRKYQPTDGYKKIHWKASARKNELMSKNFSSESKDNVVVLLDNTSIKISQKATLSEIENKIKFEDILLEACASILSYSYKNMFVTELGYIGVSELIEGSFNQLYKTMEQIHFVENDFGNYVYDFSKIVEGNKNIVIISQKINDKISNISQMMSLSGNNIIIIYFDTSDTKNAMKLNEFNKINCFNFNQLKETPI